MKHKQIAMAILLMTASTPLGVQAECVNLSPRDSKRTPLSYLMGPSPPLKVSRLASTWRRWMFTVSGRERFLRKSPCTT